jgi:hypothetical protein
MGVWSGTSFASPMAAAVAADALRFTSGRLDPDVLREAFEELGTNIDDSNPRYRQQLGLKLNYELFLSGLTSNS